ncbi:MAG: hypothetical protein ACSHYF_06250 [Verrucomicrobiaceae bacterium]
MGGFEGEGFLFEVAFFGLGDAEAGGVPVGLAGSEEDGEADEVEAQPERRGTGAKWR